MTDDCLFCKILNGAIPAQEVASSERTLAFRDINPVAPTHVLVIPREHIENFHTIGPDHTAVIAEMIATAQQVASDEGVTEGGYRLVFNVGPDTGNTVPHLHLHVLGGRRMGWPPG